MRYFFFLFCFFPSLVCAAEVTAEVRGLRVGLIDTGLSLQDSRFAPYFLSCGVQCIRGYDFVDGDTYPLGTRSAHGDRMLEAYLMHLQRIAAQEGLTHGTIHILPYRVLTEEVGAKVRMDTLVEALFQAVEDDVDVVLVSLTGPFSVQDPRFLLLDNLYRERGILLLTAAGNTSSPLAPFPASLSHALSFGVVSGNPPLLTYSNFGFPDAFIEESSLLGRQGTSYGVPYMGALFTVSFFQGAFFETTFPLLLSSALHDTFIQEMHLPLFHEQDFFLALSYLFP